MLKTKKLNKRFLSAVLGFSFALAPVPYLFSCASVPVYAADFGEFSGAVDYAVGVTGSDLYSGVTSGAIGFSWVIAALIGIQAYSDIVDGATQQGFSAPDLSEIAFCGYYNGNGDFRKLTTCGVSGLTNLVFIYADDFNIYSTTTNSNGVTYTSGYTLAYPNYVTATDYFNDLYVGYNGMARFSLSSGSSPYPTLLSSYSLSRFITSQSGSPDYIAKRIETVTLPQPLSMTNANYGESYIRDVLVPYVETNYPDMLYIFEPSYTPEYPTDFVTGIPKDWTIENPQLPTAEDLGFDHYEEDLTGFHPIQEIKETVDIIKAMDFWWWLTEKTLDSLNLKIFYVIFLTVGVLIFIVWIIGQ